MNTEQQEYFSWLRLARSKNIGAITFWRIVDYYGSAHAAVEQFTDVQKRSRRQLELAGADQVEQELAGHARIDAKLVCSYQPEYPALLREVVNPPPVLSVRGNLGSLQQKCIGMVGSRNCSIHGRNLAQQMAQQLGKAGWVIASGLARGIDGAAHHGALTTGTIAVVAGGVDIIYPPEHASLYHDLQECGAIVSEMPLGLHPGATHFPRRNRIISGLSLGVVVIEAARRSGSLITARYAAEQNREVLAVPGSPQDPRCQGANDLLKQGASLVTSAEDIISCITAVTPSCFAPSYDSSQAKETTSPFTHSLFDEMEEDMEATDYSMANESENNTPSKWQILDLLSTIPLPIDDLIRELDAPSAHVLQMLGDLELEEQIIRHPNNTITIGLHRSR